MKWYKLVGSTTPGQQVDEDWEHNDADNLTAIRFPWNKPPTQICLHDGVIVQAVVDTGLMAVQKVIGQPGINPRRGPKGSLNDRWPHTIEVETEFFCSPLKSAPKLRDVYPEFADKYAHLFRNGSHWRITDAEFDKLADVIRHSVNYIEREGRALRATEKGVQVIRLLGEHELTSPELTGQWEKRLELIAQGEESRSSFMNDIAGFAKQTVEQFDGLKGLDELKGVKIERANLGTCPVCDKDVVENRKGPRPPASSIPPTSPRLTTCVFTSPTSGRRSRRIPARPR